MTSFDKIEGNKLFFEPILIKLGFRKVNFA